ncbi:MAG: hypothetical protein Q9225_006276 [Loekoesia sp. 1 TL-2023]
MPGVVERKRNSGDGRVIVYPGNSSWRQSRGYIEKQNKEASSSPSPIIHQPLIVVRRPKERRGTAKQINTTPNLPHAVERPTTNLPEGPDKTSPHLRADPSAGLLRIPETTRFSLQLMLAHFDRDHCAKLETVSIGTPNSYDDIEAEAIQRIKDIYGRDLADKELVLRNGTATIFSAKGKINYRLSSPSDWKAIYGRLTVPDVYGADDVVQHVEIFCNYVALQNRPDPDTSYASVKRNEIYFLMSKAFDERRYISRTDLNKVATRETIQRVIAEDPPSGMSSADQDQFAAAIYQHARILFATCLSAQLSMNCLRKLLSKHVDDTTSPLEEDHKCHWHCSSNFENLLRWQWSFRAASFLTLGQHLDLPQKVIVPVSFSPIAEDENSFFHRTGQENVSGIEAQSLEQDRERSRYGRSLGHNTFRVTLDQSHRHLGGAKLFTMKELRDADSRQEPEISHGLRKVSHLHIATPLASWTQQGKCFMLFPYAQCNLRHYMSKWTFGSPLPERMLWLLGQLRGIADGLRNLHNLSDEKGPFPQPHLRTTGSNAPRSNRTHVISPENIWVCSTHNTSSLDQTPGEGRFCLAGFSPQESQSHLSSESRIHMSAGTCTYEPPEARFEDVNLRPRDVWSLGCIFLEVLIWSVIDYNAVTALSEQRKIRYPWDYGGELTSDDSFWQLGRDGRPVLHQAVDRQIGLLHNEIMRKECTMFGRVLQVVQQMLDPDHTTRIPVVHVWNTLDAIYKDISVELKSIAKDDADQERDPSISPFPVDLSEPFNPRPWC